MLVLGRRRECSGPRCGRLLQIVGVDEGLPSPALAARIVGHGVCLDPPAVFTDDPVGSRDPHEVRDGVGQTAQEGRSRRADVHGLVRDPGLQASSLDFMHSNV